MNTVGAELRFTVLGPLRAWLGDREVPLGSPQQRAVLATLLLKRGRPATVAELVDAVWGEDPPGGAVSVLRTYISRLRSLLEPDRPRSEAPRVLVSAAGGYAVTVPAGAVDHTVFEQRVREARDLVTAGDPATARELLRTALDDWTGVPLAGVPGPFADSERSRIEEQRLGATETRLRLELDLGLHRDVVPELITLTTAHPLREELRLLLMKALYRCDRQAEALAVYHDTRSTLVEQLGIDPGPALRELHELMLAADPSLLAPRAEPAPAPAHAVRPAQLPADCADFTARETETERVVGALTDESFGDGTAVRVVLLTGMGGAGKTTLAVHAAHRVAESFPDGQLYVDLRGVDGTPADPSAVLAGFLRALGEKDQAIPDSLVERAALYRSILDRRRILVVLDNAHDTEQTRPLLPGSGGCAAVVTSRSALAALPATLRVVVGVLRPGAAAELFSRIVGARRAAAERLSILRIVELCGGLPLAVRIVASRLAIRPDWSIADTARQLTGERRRLHELRIEGLAVEACFRLGYGRLDADQARAFRLLSLPAPTTLGLMDAAVLLDLEEWEAASLLETLVDCGMLESPTRDRYRYHDLVRLFARQRAKEEEPPASRDAALNRLLDYLLASTRNVYRLVRPGHTVPGVLLPTAHPGAEFADSDEAYAWGVAEIGPALELMEQLAGLNPAAAADLMLALDPVLMGEHRWREILPVCRTVEAAAVAAGDTRAQRRVCYMLGGALMQAGDNRAAREVNSRAIDLLEGSDDRTVHAMVFNVQSIVAGQSGRVPEAVELGGRAVEIARSLDDPSVESLALGNIIQTRLTEGVMDPTLIFVAQRNLAICDRLGDRVSKAMALYRLGQVLRRAGQPSEGLRRLEQALEVMGTGGPRFLTAAVLIRAAEAQLDLGRPEPAVRYAEQGIVVARELSFDQMEAIGAQTLGDGLIRLGHRSWARACWVRALEICMRLDMPELASQFRDRLATDRAGGAQGSLAQLPGAAGGALSS
jgi:DNA-binding SARP family transcriptional activator/tetratricopeptide (TPR) repeat protein